MKRRLLTLVLLVISIALLGLIGCGYNQEPEKAATLWKVIQKKPYRQWKPVPGFATPQPAKQPFTDLFDPRPLHVTIFMNDVVTKALADKQPLSAWPVGAIFVKEGFQGDDFRAVVAMEKRKEGWFWAQWDTKGNPTHSGEPENCVSCHESHRDNDLVTTIRLPK